MNTGAEQTFTGSCHCGAICVDFRSRKSPGELGSRACQCRFCRVHGVQWTSDPEGSVAVTLNDVKDFSRYRFGTKTADFIICRQCGGCPVVISDIEGRTYAVINVNCLEARAAFIDYTSPTRYDDELLSSRLARRAARWTPVMAFSA